MRTLYHQPIDPFSRKVRILLTEKSLDYALVDEPVEERRDEFLAINPAAEVPVMIDDNDAVIVGSLALTEYIEEVYPQPSMLGADPIRRAETRRLVQWFDDKFWREVTRYIVGEKLGKRLHGGGGPNSAAIRAGKANIEVHLSYVSYLVERRNWLAGDALTVADIAAAAQLSCIDYLGDVPWDGFDEARNWYARIKSRPSMREILADHIAGTPPPPHYADLDF